MDNPDPAELAAYSTLLWQYNDTGTPGPGAAAFRFTDPALNSPLFSPVRAAIRKIQAAKGIQVDSTASCWDSPGSVTQDDIKAFMLYGKIETPLDASAEVMAHYQALWDGIAEGQNVAVSVVDGKLVTVGLDPKTAKLVPVDVAPVWADPQVAELIATVAGIAQQLAATQDLSSVVVDPLVGGTPYWKPFMIELQLSLGPAGTALDSHVSFVEAAFGDYGSLMLARVDTDTGVYLLVDTVNGTVAGPYDFMQPYDARALLATHVEYQAGDTITYISKGDCATTIPVADTKTPVPGPPAPGWLPLPARPPVYPTPGRPNDWKCTWTQTNPGPPAIGTCECESTYHYEWTGPGPCPGSTWVPPMVTAPTICLIFETVKCTGTGCGVNGCPSMPNTLAPPLAPTSPGPVAPGCATPPCTSSFWYWS